MNSIGFLHFRKFANFKTIRLGDITILVGGNNSGKSTIVKAFLLCIDNLCNMRVSDRRSEQKDFFIGMSGGLYPMFRFDSQNGFDVKVKTFARAIHNRPVKIEKISSEGHSKSYTFNPSTIRFILGLEQFFFTFVVEGDKDGQQTYGNVQEIIINDTQANVCYSVNYSKRWMSYEIFNKKGQEDLSLLRNLCLQYKSLKRELNNAKHSQDSDLEQISDFTTRLEKIASQINSICDRDNEGYELSDEELDKLLRSQLKKQPHVADSFSLPFSIFLNEVNEPVVLNVISSIANYAGTKEAAPKEKEGQNPSEYGAELNDYYLREEQRKNLKQEIDTMRNSYRDLRNLLAEINVEYISAHAANQNRLYNTADRNDYIAQTVHGYSNEKIIKGESEYEFIREWMQEFGIGSDFSIKNIGGEAYTVDITDADGTVVPLSDKGMGAIQLMVLLLRLATIIRRNKNASFPTTIVIEEPEQNLHPRVQSMLANLFETLSRLNNCRFIIETHSEYIVRKAQVLVAEANYVDEEDLNEHNPFKVYYLPEDGSERYEMKFTTKGRFANKFGKGFFDTASELAFELF